ncbi:probable disease resistance protein At1g61190 [Camellia sinensis]|uniref:probable disease resistance protein At1g61190 n=1 Tax=Camellia sinensis TaxID=4442 RepID=UPI001036BA1A|nr:probable disease resistance protein At1g61190 [Camellia sinensis]
MIGLDQILSKSSSLITGGCKIAWKHIGYVIDYKKNIENLLNETEKFENELTRIDGRVERAKHIGLIPEADVLQWIASAKGIKGDVEALLVEATRENMWCLKCCPNVSQRYKLGKESKVKTASVIRLKDSGRQYMTIEVAQYAPPLKFGYNFSQGYVAFDSRAEIFEEIMKALADPCIKMIGLYGPGGVGKTTMAIEVGKLAKQNELFDDVVMATISQTLNEKAVKEKLALQLGLTLDGHAYQLYHRLNNGERNLVILDDVWKPLDLADIEIPITDGNKGCKVVITSRKREPRDARSCFLLCSLFPEDAEISIDELVRYSIGMGLLDENLNIFDEVRDRVLAMVDVLKTSCLLLDDTHESVVKMHDIIRDVAISIAEDEKRYLVKHGIEKWPEKSKYEHYSAISLRFTATIHEFPNELDCRGLHTLVLKCDNDSPTDFPNNFFNGMENNLEVLDLSEMPIKSLPSSLLTLVKLRMLCLNVGRLMRDIALLESLRNLEILC